MSVTRVELYEMVWREPMSRIAARYGISDVTLRRICERHDIPRPAAGYWSKIAYGITVERAPLPAGKFDAAHEIRLSGTARGSASQ